MYKVNDLVEIMETGEIKQIIDFEAVCGVEVYYMSDKTAYPVDEIFPVAESDFNVSVDEMGDEYEIDEPKKSRISTFFSNGINWVSNKLGIKNSTESVSDEIGEFDVPFTPEEIRRHEETQNVLDYMVSTMSKEEIDEMIEVLVSTPIKYDPRMWP